MLSWRALIATTLDVVAILSSVLVAGLIVFLVIARYVLELSVVGLHEVILLFAVFLYMFGAIIASKKREHLTVDWLQQRLVSERAKAWHDLTIAAITLILTGFFLAWTYWMLDWGLKRPQVTPGLRIPLWIPQLAILAAAVGCNLYALRDLVDAIRRLGR